MQTIYTITSPKPTGRLNKSADAILRNWYMFKVYSDNVALMKRYIQYVNSIFDKAFDILDIGIVSYEIPDNVAFDSGFMSEYINSQYDLSGDDFLTFEMHLIVEEEFNAVLGRTIEIMTNDFGYDDPTSRHTVFSVLTPSLVSTVVGITKYLRDRNLADSILSLMASVWDIMRQRAGSDFLFRAPTEELYESPLIHTPYLRILQLKYYIHDGGDGWLASYGEGMDVTDGYLRD